MNAGSEGGVGRVESIAEDGIGWIVFDNRRRHNAMSMAMWQQMSAAIAEHEVDPEVRVVVLKGAGDRAFVSGADISEFENNRATPGQQDAYEAAGDRAFAALADCTKPTLAMIRGYCLGGGLAIAVNCDIRIAAADATFSIPAARLGIGYRVSGVERLLNLVGPAWTKEIFFTARRFDAPEALNMGLVNRVVPVERLAGDVLAAAQAIAAKAPLTIAAAKRAVDELLKDPARRNLDACEEAIAACMRSADFVEGRRAFMEKRPPRFTGT